MTTIFSVDTAGQATQRDPVQQPVKDFSHELAKHSEPKVAQGNTKPTSQFDANKPPAENVETEPASMPTTDMQAVALPEALLAEQVAVTPTGVTEALLGARIFGWHAMAQAYLSELAAADKTPEQNASSTSEATSLSVASERVDMTPVMTLSAAIATANAASAPVQVQTVAPTLLRPVSDDTTSMGEAERVTANASAPAPWPERSLRFTRQRDGSSVAWLRDFRLGNAEASQLVQLVVNDAKAKGIVLSKIMLNGREAWASPNSH